MINGWVPWEFTKKLLLKIWMHPEKNHFAVESWFLGTATHRSHKKTFWSCALNLPVYGSKGHVTHCLKERQPCGSGRLMLRSQLEILSEPDTNPFECTSVYFEEAYPTLHLLDPNNQEDRDIEIEWTITTLFHFMYCSSINMQILKLRTSTKTCFWFLK